jgi:hypothetical protein
MVRRVLGVGAQLWEFVLWVGLVEEFSGSTAQQMQMQSREAVMGEVIEG